MMDHITVKGQGGTFDAYIARPKILPASAVVVLQELFGVNADIRKHCDELAEQGYLWSHQDYGRLEGIRSGVPDLPVESFVRIDGRGMRDKSKKLIADFCSVIRRTNIT